MNLLDFKIILLLSFVLFISTCSGSQASESDEEDSQNQESEKDENEDSGKIDDGGIGIIDKLRYWPRVGDQIQVPYKIDESSGYSVNSNYLIKSALKEIESKTCVKFVEQTYQPNFIKFISREGKWSGKLYLFLK